MSDNFNHLQRAIHNINQLVKQGNGINQRAPGNELASEILAAAIVADSNYELAQAVDRAGEKISKALDNVAHSITYLK